MEEFLSHTETLLNHIYWFRQDFKLTPSKEHLGTAINYTDISDRKNDFLKELVNTVASWVYSKQAANKIINDRLMKVNGDLGNASAFLTTQAFSKFRPGHPQGQFGELLLFNFVQHFFKAVPLLRKQRITTTTGHERFGSDAIHYRLSNGQHTFFLGESKCYESLYTFKTAFDASLSSIVSGFSNLNKELNLYIYDDFIEPELQKIAIDYKENTLENVHFELVCLVAYNENQGIIGLNETEIKENIKKIISGRCDGIDKACFSSVESRVLDRINYIIFPIWELDKLLESFQKLIGSTK